MNHAIEVTNLEKCYGAHKAVSYTHPSGGRPSGSPLCHRRRCPAADMSGAMY